MMNYLFKFSLNGATSASEFKLTCGAALHIHKKKFPSLPLNPALTCRLSGGLRYLLIAPQYIYVCMSAGSDEVGVEAKL